MSKIAYLSDHAKAVLEKACAYCDIAQVSCDECDGPLFPKEEKLFVPAEPKINIASGEDVSDEVVY